VIRRATEHDARAISRLIRRNAEAFLARSYTAEQLAAWRQYNTPARLRRRIADRIVFCAFYGRRLCGTIALQQTNYRACMLVRRIAAGGSAASC
jgi:hypothetical protein